MQKGYAESLLRTGVLEVKSGGRGAARRYLESAIANTNDPDVLSEAWYWLSFLAEDPAEQRAALESCLSYDFQHARARRELAVLDGKLDPKQIVNPDALAPAPQGEQLAEADRFVCPKCGGRMAFTPDGAALACEFCSRSQGLASKEQAEEQDFLLAMATARGHRKPVAVQVFHCQGCGAEFTLPPGVLSAACAWCNSPHVVSLEAKRELIPPDGILPHAFDRAQATRLLVDWVEQNGVAPQGKVEPPRGVYLPAWTFDIGGGIEYSGDRYEQEEGLGRNSQRLMHVQDEYPVYINDLPVPASRKLAAPLARLLRTFDLRGIQPYDPRYLAGWAAEVYDIPMSDASLEARSKAFERLKRDLPGEIASLFNLRMSSASLAIESFKLVLLPAWMTTLPAGDKSLLLLINGQDSVAQCEPPLPARGKGREDAPAKPKAGLLGLLGDLLD
ncbi:MAG: hypothetical protein ACOYYJ_17925 [Chloroflexota bacterium]